MDEAVGQLVTPLKMKSHLINQLKTQIEDLEMFIEFLQRENSTNVHGEIEDCSCKNHQKSSPTKLPTKFRRRTKSEQEEIRKQTVGIFRESDGRASARDRFSIRLRREPIRLQTGPILSQLP